MGSNPSFGAGGGGGGQSGSFDPTTGLPIGVADPTTAQGGAYWGNPSNPTNPNNPITASQSQSNINPPTAAGQQSGQNDVLQQLSSMLLGGGANNAPVAQGAQKKIDYQQQATEPGGQGPGVGWFDPNAAPNNQPAPGAAQPPQGAAMANLPPTEAGLPPGTPGQPDATISPQSAQISGNNTAEGASAPAENAAQTPPASPAAAGTPAAATPATTQTPDIAGSAREAGAGPPATGQTADSAFSASQGGIPPVLRDLFSLNFGQFIADLLGQQGMPQGQNQAGQPAPQGVEQPTLRDGTVQPPGQPGSPQPTANQEGVTPQGVFSQLEPTATGLPASVTNPPRQASTQTAAAAPGTIGNPMGDVGGTGGQPAPMTAAGAARPPRGSASAALPPAGAPGSVNQPPGGQPTPDGGRAPTNGMPGGLTPNAPPATPGLGAISNQGNRPRHYEGTLTMPDGQKFRYGTGGGQFASLPYGTYQIHPGAVGRIGRSIGAWGGISDSNNAGNNTVNDPLYRGGGGTHARNGVEIHPDVSGRRLITNGCIGIDRGQASTFGRSFRSAAASGPLLLTVKPDGSATITNAPAAVAGQQPGNAILPPPSARPKYDTRMGRAGVVSG